MSHVAAVRGSYEGRGQRTVEGATVGPPSGSAVTDRLGGRWQRNSTDSSSSRCSRCCSPRPRLKYSFCCLWAVPPLFTCVLESELLPVQQVLSKGRGDHRFHVLAALAPHRPDAAVLAEDPQGSLGLVLAALAHTVKGRHRRNRLHAETGRAVPSTTLSVRRSAGRSQAVGEPGLRGPLPPAACDQRLPDIRGLRDSASATHRRSVQYAYQVAFEGGGYSRRWPEEDVQPKGRLVGRATEAPVLWC